MRLYRVNKYWHFEYKTPSGPRRQTTGQTNLEDAKRMIADAGIAELEAAGKLAVLASTTISHLASGRKLSMADAVSEYARSLLNNAASRKTIANYQSVLGCFMDHQKIRVLQPNLVTPHHVSAFVNDPLDPAKSGTRHGRLSTINSFFEFLRARAWVMGNPAAEIAVDFTALSHEQKEVKVRRPIEEPEYRKIIEFCQSERDWFWEYATRMSWETGLRMIDVCTLEWASLAIPLHVVLWDKKTNARVQHQVSESVINLIEKHGDKNSKFVFPWQRGTVLDPGYRSKLSGQFTRICKKCRVHGVGFHCLRVAFAVRNMKALNSEGLAKELADRLNLDQVRKLMGHASTASTKIYLGNK